MEWTDEAVDSAIRAFNEDCLTGDEIAAFRQDMRAALDAAVKSQGIDGELSRLRARILELENGQETKRS